MIKIFQTLLIIGGMLLPTLAVSPAVASRDRASRQLRVMSYNIRYGTAADGDNHWEKRRERLSRSIRTYTPDRPGKQATLGLYPHYPAEQPTGDPQRGVARDELSQAWLTNSATFRPCLQGGSDGGHFWLSENPDLPGSKSWDTALTRMASWVRLRDRQDPRGRPIFFINTHFDHRGEQARLESARLLRRRVARDRVVITGDFNAGEDTPPYQALFDRQGPLLDTFRLVNPQRGANEGTFSGFRPENVKGPRIDWIAVSADWRVESAAIDRTVHAGRTPSDHFAVTAVITPK